MKEHNKSTFKAKITVLFQRYDNKTTTGHKARIDTSVLAIILIAE